VTWTIEFDDWARKELRKLDPAFQKDILKYLRDRLSNIEDPKKFGKPLFYEKSGLWRYRIGDIRIICKIVEDDQSIFITRIGHRKNIYHST
jgi:mRNA interferase RelE/StbE